MKFKRVPAIVEAMQVPPAADDQNIMEHGKLAAWLQMNGAEFHMINNRGELEIVTLEGNMRARNGDWIVKGVAGEFFPVKPHIFAVNYTQE